MVCMGKTVWTLETTLGGVHSSRQHQGFTFPPTLSPAPALTSLTHADCKSMNLTYQLRCTECNAFYIGEIRSSLPNRMNGHSFITTVSNSDLPVAIHTQSHQIPFQGCWSLSVVHKLADSTPDHIHRLFETAYQFILQSCHTPDSTSITPPPNSTLATA